ncbi:MAG: tRNA pseudouridine(38-40) synthase TruA [Planctomycetota bacterium]|jgi:tRNA pseudouridine38-40 synthase
MAIRKIKLTVAYDGSSYHGWQNQPGKSTIQAVLTCAVESLIGCPVKVTGASRTDAGVSALGQTASIQIDSPIPTENFAKAITDRLPPQIAVTEAVEVDSDFDVIANVSSKLYHYTIYTGRHRPVLRISHCWHLPVTLDVPAMERAAKLLLGKKDFKSFAAAADQRETTIRTIFRSDVTSEKNWIYVDIEGDAFLYNMVRNIVGTLVEMGIGRRKPEEMIRILEAKDRTAAGPIALASGLCLMWIKY